VGWDIQMGLTVRNKSYSYRSIITIIVAGWEEYVGGSAPNGLPALALSPRAHNNKKCFQVDLFSTCFTGHPFHSISQ